MFHDSRNGYQFSGSTIANDFEVSLKILKWSLAVILGLTCVATMNGCQNF